MFSLQENSYRIPVMLAVILHLMLFIFLFIHFKVAATPVALPATNIIKATAVTQSQLQSQIAKLDQHKVEVVENVADVEASPGHAALSPGYKSQNYKSQNEVQLKQQRLAQEAKEQIIKEKKAAEASAFAKATADKQEKATKTAKEEAQKKLEHELLAQQEAEATEKKLAASKAADQKRKKLAAMEENDIQQALNNEQTKATNKKQIQSAKQSTKKLLQQEINAADETEQQESAQASLDQGVIDKYKALILQAISQQWIVPENAKKDAQGKLLVHLAAGGMVLKVDIAQSSGDSVLDRSAQTAVLKASPLPVPTDPTQFDSFRTISLTFRPEGILAGG